MMRTDHVHKTWCFITYSIFRNRRQQTRTMQYMVPKQIKQHLLLWQCLTVWYIFVNTVESHFTTVRFIMIHFHNPCGVERCTPDLSKLKHPFSTYCASSSFPVCMCFFLFYFSAVLLSWLWFFHPWRPSKKTEKNQKMAKHSFLMSSEPRPVPSSAK
jgi:hypothetical protein